MTATCDSARLLAERTPTMSVEDVIARFAGNRGNQTQKAPVTGKSHVAVGGNRGNHGNQKKNVAQTENELIHWRDCTPDQLTHLWARVKLGEAVQIFSDTLNEAVWWVKDEAIVAELKQKGVIEVCYTAAELRDLAGKTPEFLRDVHQFKKRFNATLKGISHD